MCCCPGNLAREGPELAFGWVDLQVCLQPPGGAPVTPAITAAALLSTTHCWKSPDVELEATAGPGVAPLGLSGSERHERAFALGRDVTQQGGVSSVFNTASCRAGALIQHQRLPAAMRAHTHAHTRSRSLVRHLPSLGSWSDFSGASLCSSAPHSRLQNAE